MTEQQVFLPPSTIGILGGGQLGRMLALEAREMGYRIVTLDPTDDSPCGQVADEQVIAPFDSLEGARLLAQKADVLTYEFENIGARVADQLQQDKHLPQGYQLLYTTQNRLREKKAIEQAGGKVAPYGAVYDAQDVESAVQEIGFPAVLKTAEGGYDGKGQRIIRDEGDLRRVMQEWAEEHEQSGDEISSSRGKQEHILEAWVPFVHEISCIVARSGSGECQPFPIAENIHQDNILHLSIAPARVSDSVQAEAKRLAMHLAENFGLVGLLAIEMFVLEDGTLYVNEVAPRPHNSGHYTQQACHTSQFEQHIRAICNLPLADPQIIQPTVMVNILGEHVPAVLEQLPKMDASYKVHLYGKKAIKPKRKMGHLNVIAADTELALKKIKSLHIWNMEGRT